MSNELSKLDILKLFKTNLIKFIDALIEQLPDESDLIVLRIFLQEQIPIEDVMITFSRRLIPCKDMILNKEEKFFLEHNDVFTGVSSDTVNYCKNIWTSKKITVEDKEQIWKWFRLFVNLSEKFVNCK